MVQCKTIKQLELIEQKKFDDEDIQVTFLEHPVKESLASQPTQMKASLSRQPDLTTCISPCYALNDQAHEGANVILPPYYPNLRDGWLGDYFFDTRATKLM